MELKILLHLTQETTETGLLGTSTLPNSSQISKQVVQPRVLALISGMNRILATSGLRGKYNIFKCGGGLTIA